MLCEILSLQTGKRWEEQRNTEWHHCNSAQVGKGRSEGHLGNGALRIKGTDKRQGKTSEQQPPSDAPTGSGTPRGRRSRGAGKRRGWSAAGSGGSAGSTFYKRLGNERPNARANEWRGTEWPAEAPAQEEGVCGAVWPGQRDVGSAGGRAAAPGVGAGRPWSRRRRGAGRAMTKGKGRSHVT